FPGNWPAPTSPRSRRRAASSPPATARTIRSSSVPPTDGTGTRSRADRSARASLAGRMWYSDRVSHWGRDGMATRFWGTLQWPALAAPRLPERIPDLKRPWLYIFELFWFALFALAIVGPIAGTWYRFTTPGENSQLMTGSRAGLVLARDDLTTVRFPVGSAAQAAGIQPGDKIIAIDGLPLSRAVPLDPAKAVGPGHATDTDYALLSPIVEGNQPIELDLTLRSPAGEVRNFHVRTGEQHISQA